MRTFYLFRVSVFSILTKEDLFAMKLKKIASLALAGVMAVSMLAGCNGGTSNNGTPDDDGGDVVVTTSPIVKAVNDGQTSGNVVKINFTDDSKLNTALQKAVEVYGTDAMPGQIEAAITNNTGLETKSADVEDLQYINNINANVAADKVNGYGFLSNLIKYENISTKGGKKGDLNGKVYTYVNVEAFPALSEEAALNYVAQGADAMIAELAAVSNDATNDGVLDKDGAYEVNVDGKYYDYDYTGSISMVSVTTIAGTTTYYVAYVVNQTVTEKTL